MAAPVAWNECDKNTDSVISHECLIDMMRPAAVMIPAVFSIARQTDALPRWQLGGGSEALEGIL